MSVKIADFGTVLRSNLLKSGTNVAPELTLTKELVAEKASIESHGGRVDSIDKAHEVVKIAATLGAG